MPPAVQHLQLQSFCRCINSQERQTLHRTILASTTNFCAISLSSLHPSLFSDENTRQQHLRNLAALSVTAHLHGMRRGEQEKVTPKCAFSVYSMPSSPYQHLDRAMKKRVTSLTVGACNVRTLTVNSDADKPERRAARWQLLPYSARFDPDYGC